MCNRIGLLKEKMRAENIQACVIPTGDPHMSEYPPDCYKLREWLSGFTGSAGTLVVTENRSGLWTDGRYYLQAESELKNTKIKLYKASEKECISIEDFLINTLKSGDTVGFCGELFAKNELDRIKAKLGEKGININIKFEPFKIWKDRPGFPSGKAYVLDEELVGEKAVKKIEKIRKELEKTEATHYLISSPDSVMWTLNIRGTDVYCTPVMLSYMLIDKENAVLFAHLNQIDENMAEYLKSCKVEVRSYDDICSVLKSLSEDKCLAADFTKVNYLLAESAGCRLKNISDIADRLKAVKNRTEIENIKKTYIVENTALIKSFYRIYNASDITEYDVAGIIEEERKKFSEYISPSFDTIAAYRENAAIVHYTPDKAKSAKIGKNAMLLIDTGGQYTGGTTDTTRTLTIGNISKEEADIYSLVLKCNIRLAMCVFPEGIRGCDIDAEIREPLWKYGLDYRHGSGHGVGYMLCVHEGPQSISRRSDVKLVPGMTVTDEPGVYIENKYGVRIENHLHIIKKYTNEYGNFLSFEALNYCPVGTEFVNGNILSDDEKSWINEYNSHVRNIYRKYLTEEEYLWLQKYTVQI